MNGKKPLEELLTELKEELEDLIPVINRLQKELPGYVASKLQNLIGDLKTELQKFNQIQKEKGKKLQNYVAKAEKTLQKLEQSASEIRKDYENLNTLLAQQINANLEWLQTEISNLLTRLEEIKEEVRSSAKEGIEESVNEQTENLREKLRQINTEITQNLTEIVKILKAIQKGFNDYKNSLEGILEKYQYSWLIPFAFLSILILIGLLFIGLETANKTRASEILLGFIEVIFLITATYLSLTIWKKLQNLWLGYILSALFFAIAIFIGYTTYKGKVQIVNKVNKVFKPPKPEKVITFDSGEKCWVYKGFYTPDSKNPNFWNFYKQTICIPEKSSTPH